MRSCSTGSSTIKSLSLVPQQGYLHLVTEFGQLYVKPNEIAVVQVSGGGYGLTG